MKSKTCIDCQKRKPVDAFYAVHKGSEHRQSRCKQCDNRKRIANGRRERHAREHRFALVAGVEGMALYLNDYRVAGPKPWGGGVTRNSFTVSESDLRDAMRRAPPVRSVAEEPKR